MSSVNSIRPLFILGLVLFYGCASKFENRDFTFGANPGQPVAAIQDNKIELYNEAIHAQWELQAGKIILRSVTNKYDKQTVELGHVTLFAVELENRGVLTNHDFFLKDALKIENLPVIDTLPAKALSLPGMEINGRFISEDKEIEIVWKVQLREGSNYIRQQIEISPVKFPVRISKVILFDGKLEGATYAGSVLGSPITYKNFFFGLEHPIAQSKALLSRQIGAISQDSIDVSPVIDAPGNYTVSVEHGWGPAAFNIQSVSLYENGELLSTDQHPLNGHGGSSFYHLELERYLPGANYSIHRDAINEADASGSFHLYRKSEGILNFFVVREDTLYPGECIAEWSVIGVSPENQDRRAFQYYLENERARPYKQFLHYNCWWDITNDGASSFTSEQLIERMHAWNEKFIRPYGVKLHSFVFDDGWDDLDRVWYFDPVKFPEGFAPQAELCKKYNAGIGVWMSPFGGYMENKQRRLQSARSEGLEINEAGLSLSGQHYYNRFLERSLDMLENYHVNYFKFDGFGGSNPKYLPDMEAGARLISELRRHNPDVFINITVGSWPSPFWLFFADCTWRGSGDASMAGEGSRTQQFITYRDGTLHNNIVKRAPYYPLNSIMVVGIAYANLGHPIICVNDSIEDFTDMVRSFFGAGSSLQELYISHDRMKDEFWSVLAEAAIWAQENQDVLKDVHWIGGSPINLEVYGFASWRPGKGIITLRNPGAEHVAYALNLEIALELPENQRSAFELRSPWKEDQGIPALKCQTNESCSIELNPFETKVLEVTPVGEPGPDPK